MNILLTIIQIAVLLGIIFWVKTLKSLLDLEREKTKSLSDDVKFWKEMFENEKCNGK